MAGTIIYRSGGKTGLGLSANVNNFFRDTHAFIGADPTVDPQATPTSTSTLALGDTTITSTLGGTIVGVSVAGTFSSALAAPSQNVVNPVDGVNGPNGALPNVASSTGIAGSGAAFVFVDNTFAYMNLNTVAASRVGALSLSATNDQTIILVSGGVAVGLISGGNQTSSQWSAAFSMNLITSDTEAFIKGVSLASAGAVSVTALHGGALDSFSAALAFDSSQTGNAFAGSVSINRAINTTKAIIDNATIGSAATPAASIALSATDQQEILSIGGGASFTAGLKGVGASFGYNQLAGETTAGVFGSARRSSLVLAGDLTVSATNKDKITAIGVSAGVTTAAGATAAAFTIGINILSSNSKVFSRENAVGLVAEVKNADVISNGGKASITATDKSSILAIGGAVAVGVKGSAFGAGLGWNQMALNIDAEVNNAAITATTGGVTVASTSSQDDAPLSSKIVSASVGAAVSAGGQGPGTAIGVNVSVNGTFNTISAHIDGNPTVTAGGDVAVAATDNSKISALSGAVAISTTGTGAGAALSGNYISNIVKGTIDASTVHATSGKVTVAADEEANIQALAVGLEGGQKYAGGGSISVAVITDTVEGSIAGAALVTASNKVAVESTNNATIGTLAGQIAIGGKVGVGISVVTAVVVNNNSAFIAGTANVTGNAGVSVNANTTEDLSVIAVGGALGGSTAGVAATTTVTVVNDSTLAYIGAVATPAQAGTIRGGTGSGSSGDVTVDAESGFNLLGTAGALTFGGKAGVGVGVDAGVVTRVTQAYIGANAKVAADGSVSVLANATETIRSFSIAGAFSGTAAVGLTAGVSTLNLTTKAYVDTGAIVFANNNALVSAEDQTTLTLVSGNLTGSGTAAVGVGAGISVLNKNTNSYIASDAQVTALASGAAVQANTGRFGQASGNNDPVPAVNVDFTTANVANNTISAASHGLSTGNEVVYSGANLPLGGLNNGGAYFVIKVNDNQFKLAKSFADAQAGIAIALSAGLTSQTDQHTAQRLNPIGVPSVWTDNVPTSQLNLSNLAKNLEGPPQQAARQGVIVVAVSTSHMEGAGAAGGGSGSVAVSVAGGFAVHTINTTASIGSGAQINQTSGGSAQQSVYVDAGRAYHNLTLGIGAAFSGAVAISPAVAVPILQGTTSAKIIGAGSTLVKDDGTTSGGPTLVSAKQDVEVAAVAQADFIAVAVGLTASGTAAIAGSGAVIVVTTTTEASIGGLAQVAAGGNVLVSALDVTTAYAIAGGVGIGIGGGGGAGAFAVSVITKNTNAYIRDDAVVDAGGNGSSLLTGIMTGDLNTQQAIRGVAVQAYSSETLVNVAGSGAGGSYVGIAGSVDAEIVNSNTVAAIFGGAQVNQNNSATANALQTVAVGARNDLKVTAVAGAVAISATVGVGAGADIQVIRNNAVAFIADSGTKVRARNAVDVDALSTRDILSIGVAAGVGQFALAGGISVISIGGAFSDQYTGGSEGGSSYSSNALSGGNSGSVIPSIDDAINKALAALDTPDSGGLPAINPATAVNNTNHTVNFGVADNLSTGDAVQYSTGGGAPIAGLQNNQTYFVITQGPNAIQLAATRDDALAGRFIEIASNGATGTTHQFSNGNASIANAARTTATPALPNSPLANGTQPPVVRPIASGTSALVGSGAEIAASTLAVQANQLFNLQSYPGSLGLSAYASLGVGLAVVNIASSVTAYISPAVTITGLGGSGSLLIDATRNATTKVLGIAGSVSGLIALGSAVAYVSDTSSVQATLGVNVTDSGLFQANSASGAATVGGAGFALIEVDAEHTETMNLATGAGSLSLIVGLGAAITVADIEGNTRAIIGDYSSSRPATSSPSRPTGPRRSALTTSTGRWALVLPEACSAGRQAMFRPPRAAPSRPISALPPT